MNKIKNIFWLFIEITKIIITPIINNIDIILLLAFVVICLLKIFS